MRAQKRVCFHGVSGPSYTVNIRESPCFSEQGVIRKKSLKRN